MPTYEYKCENCEMFLELKKRVELGPECENCGHKMRRVWHAPGVHFKGSGFYKTDNP